MGLSKTAFVYPLFSLWMSTIEIGFQCSLRIGNGDRSGNIYCFMVYDIFIRKGTMPSNNRMTIRPKKVNACTGIRTRLARKESHCYTACNTTAALNEDKRYSLIWIHELDRVRAKIILSERMLVFKLVEKSCNFVIFSLIFNLQNYSLQKKMLNKLPRVSWYQNVPFEWKIGLELRC